MEKENYFIGLDMGTSSVGWAVTDEDYNLVRRKGKDLWGSRLFEEAKTSKERRANRVSRRRIKRERVRIGMLEDFFSKEIERVDPSFFIRLDESKFLLEDKKDKVKDSAFTLFNDKDYTDKDYHKEFPTIFHLNKELIENNSPHDVRLVFLSLLNMFKHRGHFLNQTLGDDGEIEGVVSSYFNLLDNIETNEESISLPREFDQDKFKETLSSRETSKSKKTDILKELFLLTKENKKEIEIVKAFCGLKFNLITLFSFDIPEDSEMKKGDFSISFSELSYDEKVESFSSFLTEDDLIILESMKGVYESALLENILQGEVYLSFSRVKDYEKHHKDLDILQKFIKENKRELYDDIFRKMGKDSYSMYVKSVNSYNSKTRRNAVDEKGKKIDSGDFLKYIKKLVESVGECEEGVYILGEIENENFLPKQRTGSNGTIPNQVYVREMKVILKNAENYLPFLKEKDENGLTVSERIVLLFKFQIPYYVGPIPQNVQKEGSHVWAIRKENGRILPWNIDNKLDLKSTSEAFIENMIRHCTYLNNERVLPKESMLYQKYCVLNELNNLRINGERVKPELKKKIYVELFEKNGKEIKQKQLIKFLKVEGIIEDDNVEISGLDGDFNNYLSSYGRFYKIFGDDLKKDSVNRMVEDIIFYGTIYGDDKKSLKEKILELYPECINEEQWKKIKGFKFRDWGNLSKAFLTMYGKNKRKGEEKSLISSLYEESRNLMELMSDEYTYQEELEKRVEKKIMTLHDVEYEDLDELYFSPPVKRMVWQTILVLKDIVKVMGKAPDKIFVEMARGGGEKGKRTESRKNKLINLYKSSKEDTIKIMNELNNYNDYELRSKKLYLYFIQQGKSMYSGKTIDINSLMNDNLYDIDHIYPQSRIKDDSLDNNCVLVEKDINNEKRNDPLNSDIQKRMGSFWKTLLNENFITKEKYERLMCREFTDELLSGFINRQIVETRQGTKKVATLLKEVLPNTTVIYVKAGNVSDFRSIYHLYKCRSVNDFHHANDAYLNIVVGNSYYSLFTNNVTNYIKEGNREYNLSNIFSRDIKAQRTDKSVWKKGKEGTIVTIKKTMKRNTPLVTEMTYERNGAFSDATLIGTKELKKENPETYFPLKTKSCPKYGDIYKYGGKNKISNSFMSLIEFQKNNKRERFLITIPVYINGMIKNGETTLEKYCNGKFPGSRIILNRINFNSLVKVDGFYGRITGKTNDSFSLDNAISFFISSSYSNYVRKLEKTKQDLSSYFQIKFDNGKCEMERKGDKREDVNSDKELVDSILNINGITKEKNIHLFKEIKNKFIRKGFGNYISKKIPKMFQNEQTETLFMTLDIISQIYNLFELIKLITLSNETVDLRFAKESKQSGKKTISNNLSNFNEFVLIYQSPTGLFRKEIDLKTFEPNQ